MSIQNTILTLIEKISPKLLFKIKILLKVGCEREIEFIPYLCKKDMISIDIGSNWGRYTFEMSKYSKKVYAFEPNPKLCKFLRKVFDSNIEIKEIALSDTESKTNLRYVDVNLGISTIEEENQLNGENKISSIQVKTKKLDQYNFEPISLIKIDVEGHEQVILNGAKNILQKFKPAIIIEIEERHKPNSIDYITKFLEKIDYHGFFILNNSLQEINKFEINKHQNFSERKNIGIYINNFIFLQKDQISMVQKFL